MLYRASVYHGATLSLRRQMTHGLFFRLGYTYAHAIDGGQDALVAGRPATVQNSYSPKSERGSSVTDQRYRIVFSWIYEPRASRGDKAGWETFPKAGKVPGSSLRAAAVRSPPAVHASEFIPGAELFANRYEALPSNLCKKW